MESQDELTKRIAISYRMRAKHLVALDRVAELVTNSYDELSPRVVTRQDWMAIGHKHAKELKECNYIINSLKTMVIRRADDEKPYDRTPESLGFPRPEVSWNEWLWNSSRNYKWSEDNLSRRETDKA